MLEIGENFQLSKNWKKISTTNIMKINSC